jgi:hypothetical protein
VVQFIAGGPFWPADVPADVPPDVWWLGGDRRLTVEDMDGLFRQLAIPAMRA